jgi:hypothetical protein
MSSIAVRSAFKTFLTANAPTEKIIDLTAQYAEIKEMVKAAGITDEDPWLGLEFIGNDEIPVTLPANNALGKYRESGSISVHVVGVAKLGVGDAVLARGETLRDLLRGRRIGNIIVESVSPMNFGPGTTLQFEGGYMSGSFFVSYLSDRDL